VISKKILDITEKLKDNYLSSKYSFEEISIFQKTDFGCSFLVMLYMYIGHMSKNRTDFTRNLEKLRTEMDVVVRTKQWIVSLLSDKSENRTIRSLIPQWLHQIVEMSLQDITKENKKRNHSVVTLSKPITSLQNRKKHHHQSFGSQTHNMDCHLRNESRLRQKLSKQPITLHVKLHFFDHARNHTSVIFQEFITHVRRIAELQHQSRTDTMKKLNHPKKKFNYLEKNKDNQFCIAYSDNHSISAIDFESLLDNSWLNEQIVSFVGNVINNNTDVNVHSSQFLVSLFSNPDNTQTQYSIQKNWNKLINQDANTLFIPIYQKSNQWKLCVLLFSSKKIFLYNSSSNNTHNQNYISVVRDIISQIAKKVSAIPNQKERNKTISRWNGHWSSFDMSSSSPQHGSCDDSGIFTILNMAVLSSRKVFLNKHTYSQDKIYQCETRLRIAQIIFQHINWNEFNTVAIDNQEWISFIRKMKQRSIPSWGFVTQTVAL
jgi:hypothetical protein